MSERASEFVAATCLGLMACGPIAFAATFFSKSNVIAVLAFAAALGTLAWIPIRECASVDPGARRLHRLCLVNTVLMSFGIVGMIVLLAFGFIMAGATGANPH